MTSSGDGWKAQTGATEDLLRSPRQEAQEANGNGQPTISLSPLIRKVWSRAGRLWMTRNWISRSILPRFSWAGQQRCVYQRRKQGGWAIEDSQQVQLTNRG